MSCGVTFSTSGQKVVADDIIFLLPWEKGQYKQGNGFTYNGDSVTVIEKDRLLRVNGKYYGSLQVGDSVDLTTKGMVLVNGKPRQPV